ncbi:hypothetical protein YQE_05637, partial [Dendroctonus ponderosae]
MAPIRLICLCALVFLCLQTGSGVLLTFSSVLDIVKAAKDIGIALVKAWDLVDQNIDFSEVPIPILHKTENKLFGRIERINNRLDDLAARVDTIGNIDRAQLNFFMPSAIFERQLN